MLRRITRRVVIVEPSTSRSRDLRGRSGERLDKLLRVDGGSGSGRADDGRIVMWNPAFARRHDAHAMGTSIGIIGPDAPGFERVVRAVEETFGEEEQRYSRFRPTSELSGQRRRGKWTTVSDPFAALLRFALDRANATRGLFDPPRFARWRRPATIATSTR